EAYTQAKANIIRFQQASDYAVLCHDDPGSRGLGELSPGKTIWFSAQEMVTDGAFLAGRRLLVAGAASPDSEPQVVCEKQDIPLRGDHNVLNVMAACALTGVAGVAPDMMAAAIRDFKPVEHRQETVRVLNGVTYVNDSIATAPERVLASLRSYDEPVILLAGGKDKALPWEEMIRLALHKTRHIVAFGHAGELVVRVVCEVSGSSDHVTQVATLEEAVHEAVQWAKPGDVVLLSPGGTSYDAYVDFEARGEHFRRIVSELR
ncbi:MAG: UDP-N-acetylmuramoyl-L-alanine--D-glutamate ligase, partial [Anaerolineae bacterium]|nr:UDP-N-acetylmuramoyl-L-alanine--D-glutamate ligase [Anaerolineae bacterium]